MIGQQRATLDELDVRFVPGLNEELGATAVWGSQVANVIGTGKYDGVLGMWYGKAPGLDRASDAIREANWVGVGEFGGALAVVGDDPQNKSSALPSASELTLADLELPVVYPGSVAEVIALGRYAYELSRYCGAWSALKIVTEVADAYQTVPADRRAPASSGPSSHGATRRGRRRSTSRCSPCTPTRSRSRSAPDASKPPADSPTSTRSTVSSSTRRTRRCCS